MRHYIALFSAAGMLSACAGEKAGNAVAESTPAAATAEATPQVVTITAKDFSYEAPDTIASGMVSLRLVNQGPEMHHVQLVRLMDGKTYADFEAGLKAMKPGSPPPPWAQDVAGPNSPVPGGEQTITQQLEPGNYAIVCFIPSADKVPHVMKGMSKALTVVASTAPAAPAPVADASIMMTDYAWQITPALTPGKHVIKIENAAAQSHEFFIAKLEDGKKAADLAAWIESPNGPPPGKPMGGISGMTKGAVVYLPVDLEPGEYGVYCFLPDAKDGKPHVAHGMMTQVSVK